MEPEDATLSRPSNALHNCTFSILRPVSPNCVQAPRRKPLELHHRSLIVISILPTPPIDTNFSSQVPKLSSLFPECAFGK
jgi:hypothetical protein